MKIIRKVNDKDGTEKEKVVHICPVCGKEMNETYLGRDYCEECARKLEGNKK